MLAGNYAIVSKTGIIPDLWNLKIMKGNHHIQMNKEKTHESTQDIFWASCYVRKDFVEAPKSEG